MFRVLRYVAGTRLARVHLRQAGSRRYKPGSSYNQHKLAEAISMIHQGESYRDVAKRFDNPTASQQNSPSSW